MSFSKKNAAVIRFPGTNCDQDVFDYVKAHGFETQFIWHTDQFKIQDYDFCFLPGGFSYGDYLRTGALAALSPVMRSVKEFAEKGKPVLGICNGFQILCEAGLLDGALVRNDHLKFVDDWVQLNCENENSFFGPFEKKQSYRIPIAHGDGRFFATDDQIKKIEDNGQVWLRYGKNPNGSIKDIAGITNKNKNVCGLMPHPERAFLDWMGSKDGWSFL